MRLVTFNTWKGEGAYRRRLDLIAAGLHALTPDVVCLQESLSTPDGRLDTAGELARRLKLNLAWAPARFKERRVDGRKGHCFSGLAILSRYSIERHRQILLPSHPRDPGRFAQWVDIAMGPHRQRVVNLHLTHIRGAGQIRVSQLNTLLTALHCDFESPDRVWICGDFNARPDDAAMRVLRNRADWAVTDGYTAGGGTLPGTTFPVLPANSDSGRIDRILVLTRNGRRPPILRQACVVLNTPDADGLYPSDHAGVMLRADSNIVPYENLIGP